jgi:predicted AlkP superfamily pyrophosphatase or phosphodiesterase
MNIYVCRLLVLAAFCMSALTASAGPRAEHVFLICIDGGKPSVIHQSEMPVLQKLAAEGAHTWQAQTVFPSWTLPVITSTMTGVTQDKHKITWNNDAPQKGVVQVPTVFSVAKQAGFSTAMFVGKHKFRTLVQPGTVDKFDFNDPTAHDVTKSMEGEPKPMTEGTVPAKVVAADAALYIVEKKPNLCFIHFTDTDDIGHKFGWGSPEQIRAFAGVDAALGVVVKAIQDAGIADQSVLIISADHGGHDQTHGGNTPADMTIPWIAWGKGVKKNFEITAPVNTCDTAVTALWLLDCSFPSPVDGKLVTSAFE